MALAADLARKAIGELEASDYVVIPSGSCADQIRNVYPQLLAVILPGACAPARWPTGHMN